MHAEIYNLIESMEDIVERYPLEDLRQLGLELRRHSEKKGLNPLEEIVLRRVGGMLLETQRVRERHLKFVDCYMYGYDAYPSGANALDELNVRIKTLMAIGQGAFGSKRKGKRIKDGMKKSQSTTPYVDYLTKKLPSKLGNDEFKFLAKAGYIIASDEHMIATFMAPYCKSKTVLKAKKLLKDYGFPVE